MIRGLTIVEFSCNSLELLLVENCNVLEKHLNFFFGLLFLPSRVVLMLLLYSKVQKLLLGGGHAVVKNIVYFFLAIS